MGIFNRSKEAAAAAAAAEAKRQEELRREQKLIAESQEKMKQRGIGMFGNRYGDSTPEEQEALEEAKRG